MKFAYQKPCTDCQFHEETLRFFPRTSPDPTTDEHLCHHNSTVDVVTGKDNPLPCSEMRSDAHAWACGREGRFWRSIKDKTKET